MTTPDDHTLNACLAWVIGKEIRENACGPTNLSWWCWKSETEEDFGEWIKWDPLHDANQMEEVEAWLIDKGVYPSYSLEYTDLSWRVYLSIPGKIMHQQTKVYTAKDPDKKRAFALAVYAMEQSQKGTT